MSSLTLLDLAERTGSDAVIGLIEEVVTVAPEFDIIPVKTKKGTSYRVTRRIGLPTVGFRPANQGVTPSKSTYKQEVKPMYFFDAQMLCDEAIVKADEGELGSVLADESTGVIQAMGIALGTQTWIGQSADAYGFLGLADQMGTASTYTVDAAGSGTVATAWLVWLDPGGQGVTFVVGNEGEMALGTWTKQQVVDTNNTARRFMAWVNNMSFYIGLATHSEQSVWRIKNITTAAPLTDALGAKLLANVPIARRSGLRWFMNRGAAYLLQNSRATAASYVGKDYPDAPTALAGIPITVTDSVVDGAAY